MQQVVYLIYFRTKVFKFGILPDLNFLQRHSWKPILRQIFDILFFKNKSYCLSNRQYFCKLHLSFIKSALCNEITIIYCLFFWYVTHSKVLEMNERKWYFSRGKNKFYIVLCFHLNHHLFQNHYRQNGKSAHLPLLLHLNFVMNKHLLHKIL